MGQRVLGGYELLGKLTSTERNELFLARRAGATLDKIVVLKLVPASDVRTQGRALGRVARLLARFDHPHITPLLDFGRCEEGLYLVLEHIDGETLAALVRRCNAGRRPLSAPAIAYLGAAVTRALDYCREQAAEARTLGWLSWQPSLEHVLIGYDGAVKLIGFVSSDGPAEPRNDSLSVAALLRELAEAREGEAPRPASLLEVCSACVPHSDVEPPAPVELARRLEGLARSPNDGPLAVFDEHELRTLMASAFASERARRRQLIEVALSTHGSVGGPFLDRMAGRAPVRRPTRQAIDAPAETRVLPTKLTLGVLIGIGVIALVAPRAHTRDDSPQPPAAPVAPAPDRRIIVIESPEPEPSESANCPPSSPERASLSATTPTRAKPAAPRAPVAGNDSRQPERPSPARAVAPPPLPVFTGSRGGGGLP